MDDKLHDRDLDYDLQSHFDYPNAADAAGLWFAAAVLFAVLAAGIIIYRAADPEICTAAINPVPPTAHFDAIDPPPILPRR